MSATEAPSRETLPTDGPLPVFTAGATIRATELVDPFLTRHNRSPYPDEAIAERLFPDPDSHRVLESAEPPESAPEPVSWSRRIGLLVTLSLSIAAGILLLL